MIVYRKYTRVYIHTCRHCFEDLLSYIHLSFLFISFSLVFLNTATVPVILASRGGKKKGKMQVEIDIFTLIEKKKRERKGNELTARILDSGVFGSKC